MTIKVSVTGWEDPNSILEDTDVILTCDSGLTGTFTDFANAVHSWCFDKNIDVDLIGKWSAEDIRYDCSRWRIKNEVHRTMFILRWAHGPI
jgi:hypothetical protein